MEKGFQFELGRNVTIALGLGGFESGQIIGRAEYDRQPAQYFVGYIDGNGCYTKAWFDEEDLTVQPQK